MRLCLQQSHQQLQMAARVWPCCCLLISSSIPCGAETCAEPHSMSHSIGAGRL
jgi:hypothetical protein